MHIPDAKATLRQAIKERMEHLSDTDRTAESRSICRRILPEIPAGSVVAAYYPLRSEANILPLIEELIERGDTICLPRFTKENMTFHTIENLESLEKGELNIPEPPRSAPEITPTVILVPGRAFDRSGNRLGRGNGGYDIYLSRHPDAKTIGVCLDCQLMTEVPTEPHDRHMDCIATPRELIDSVRRS